MKYVCKRCQKEIEFDEVSYLGPEDQSDQSCSLFQRFICLCEECDTNKSD